MNMEIESNKEARADQAVKDNSGLNLLAVNASVSDVCNSTVHTRELSRVGPFLSTQTDTETDCGGAHPSNSHDFSVLNTVSKQRVSLTDIFKSDDIFNALMKDKQVQNALNSVDEHPANLQEFLAVFSNKGSIPVFQDRPDRDTPISFSLNGNIMDEFAFHHTEGNKVAVRLKLDPVGEADRNLEDQLGILLPIPKELQNDFNEANKHKNGEFLMKDSRKFGKSTNVESP